MVSANNFSAETLFAEVMWCLNSTPQHAGVTSSQMHMGHTPRDPLGVHELTTTAALDEKL